MDKKKIHKQLETLTRDAKIVRNISEIKGPAHSSLHDIVRTKETADNLMKSLREKRK